jgi:glycosyltransferase involved in cell wall biosynthesis
VKTDIGKAPSRRVLLVTNELSHNPKGGRELLCKLNHDLLKSSYGDNLFVMELTHHQVNSLLQVINAFRGHIDGLDSNCIKTALRVLRENEISRLFIDGSNLGGLANVIKRSMPQVTIVTFFHNVEARFFLGSYRTRKSLHAAAVLLINYLAERRAVRCSDRRVCLSERDSRLLMRIYGRGATHISPMSLQDKISETMIYDNSTQTEPFALFVGGTFYANRVGITWYVKNVAPYANIKVCIVGRGFESLRESLEIPGKIDVIGEVDDLSDWYNRASFVIAPIFDGSGMKTKVAEALMYGKKVIGTPEAFSGYEEITAQAGWVCRTAAEFVTAINEAKTEVTTPFDPVLREIYLKNYSFEAAKERMIGLME